MNTFIHCFESPLGTIEIKGTAAAITAVNFVETPTGNSTDRPDVILQCKTELEEYFSGNRTNFSVNISPSGSDFQINVWNELKKIPFGETASYLTVAKRINNPNGVRAVGLANGKNPIAIILPCHRIIGENGKLTGYAGGLWRKHWLLKHEGSISGKKLSLF